MCIIQEGGIDDGNSDIRRQGRITGMGRKGNRHAERLAAEARRALEVSNLIATPIDDSEIYCYERARFLGVGGQSCLFCRSLAGKSRRCQ